MPTLKIKSLDDNTGTVKLQIDLADDGAQDHIEAFARFMLAAGFTPDAIASAMTAWCLEHGEDGQP